VTGPARSREDAGVTVRVPSGLVFLLPPRDRPAGERRLRWDPDATLAHVVQAAGVPLTEVGALQVDGVPAGPGARARPGAVVEVAGVQRPEPVPPGGFLLDVGLGALARRLRLLGLDAAWSNRADDAELAARAGAEQRVLLTQDRGLLRRRTLGPAGAGRGALVRGSRPDDQLVDVLDRFAPPLAPLTRCTACGDRLERVPKAEVTDRLPAGTRRSHDHFSRCPACGRVYWRGAHARRIDALVALARTVG
jgi:uncharacterized protein with PIN domain